jgi:hypothetical protein
MKTALLVLIPFLFIACDKKNENVSPAEPPSAPPSSPKAAAAPVSAPTAAPAAAPASAAALLTDEKVKGYVIYTKEIGTVAAEAMGMAGSAYARSKGDQKGFERALSADERTKKVAAASQAALEKSHLTQAEVGQLTQILSPYYTRRMMAKGAEEAMAKAKAASKGKAGILEGIYKKQIDEVVALRAEMEKKYGSAAMAIMDKYEKDCIEAQEAMVKAAFRRPPK